jgi:hypothetical protein
LTVARLIVRSVNVCAEQDADRLHVSFACDPTTLVASQRHERLLARTPTQSRERKRATTRTFPDNAIVEPCYPNRPTASVTLCRTRNDRATNDLDRNGSFTAIRALETRSNFRCDLTSLRCCANLLLGNHRNHSFWLSLPMRDVRASRIVTYSMTQSHTKINPENRKSLKLVGNWRKLAGFVCGKVT